MRIVMIGNCQVQALLGLYKRFAKLSHGQTVIYIRSYEDISPSDRQVIASADVVIEQVQDFRPKGDIAGITTKAERIGVPVVNCGFLWPFAGQPHPHNPRRPYREGGPYGSESSDAYLNRLIKKGIDPDTALASYRDLDVNGMVSLDRLLEVSLDRQRARDELTGFEIAPVIETYFRIEQVFLTPYHPNVRVAVALAAQFFAKLGVDPADTARMQRAVRITPFPKEELPVHPAVARHFGLQWAGEERTYRFLHEGYFSFAEFVPRYMACAWNETLDEGIEAARTGDLPRAHDLLVAALADSPNSGQGHSTLAHVLERSGRQKEALPVSRRAVALEPYDAGFRLQLALLLFQFGDAHEAEREMRLAAALEPFDPHFPGMLANRLSRDGVVEEAAVVAWHGLVCSPYAPNLHMELGHARSKLGDGNGAADSYQRALLFDPENFGARLALADTLERTGRTADALGAVRAALKLRPGDPALRLRLARLLEATGQPDAGTTWRDLLEAEYSTPEPLARLVHELQQAGRLPEAEAAARRASQMFPAVASFRRDLAHMLERRGAVEEALQEVEQACAIVGDDVNLQIRRGDLLARLGRVEESEAAFRAAIACAPENAHAHGQLGHILSVQKRHDEAIEMRQEAIRLDPTNIFRRAQLGHTLMSAGRFDAAEREIRATIAGKPEAAAFHIDLSHVLDRAGKLDEAIDAAQRGVALEPRNARFHAHYAGLLDRARAYDDAEAAYRAAIANGLREAHYHLQLSRLVARRGDIAEARQLAEEALRIDPNNKVVNTHLQSLGPVAAVAG